MLTWDSICADPQLQNLPFKIETNECGKIMMAPVKVRHSGLVWEVLILMHQGLPEGKVLPECAIVTRKGVRVCDVAWCSQEHWEKIKHESAASIAPEICVEVMSESNTEDEMQEKRMLYIEKGAEEFWVCSESGALRFYDAKKQLLCSKKIPDMPNKVL